MKCWRIVQWDDHETAESRKYVTLTWYKKPNKHDGLGFRSLAREKDRCVLYAGWVLICDVASRGKGIMRGWVERNGDPLGPKELALMTGFDEATFDRAMQFFAALGWLEEAEFPPRPAASSSAPGDSPGRPAASSSAPGDQPRQIREIREEKSGVEGTGGKNNGGSSPAAGAGETKSGAATMGTRVAASKAQFSALQARITELEAREDRLKPEERQELQDLQKKRRELQQRQAAGKF